MSQPIDIKIKETPSLNLRHLRHLGFPLRPNLLLPRTLDPRGLSIASFGFVSTIEEDLFILDRATYESDACVYELIQSGMRASFSVSFVVDGRKGSLLYSEDNIDI